jgi:hypothetical protein
MYTVSVRDKGRDGIAFIVARHVTKSIRVAGQDTIARVQEIAEEFRADSSVPGAYDWARDHAAMRVAELNGVH